MARNKYLIFVFFLLCACSADQEGIKFVDNKKISVDSVIDTCSFVKSVDGKKISRFDYDGNRILVNEKDMVVCPSLDTSKIGKTELKYRYKEKEYSMNIEIIDDKKPVIECSEKQITLKAGVNESDLLSKIKVNDHDKNIKVSVTGVDFSKTGEYLAVINAKDHSGNSSTYELKVIIEEKQPEKESNQEKVDSDSSKHDVIDQQVSENVSNKNEIPPVTVYPESKSFLFSEGYDYESSYAAAVSYAKSVIASGKANAYSCEPIKNGNEYIGYIVKFN